MKDRHISNNQCGKKVLPKGFIKRGKALVFSTDGTELLDNDTVENIRLEERDHMAPTESTSHFWPNAILGH